MIQPTPVPVSFRLNGERIEWRVEPRRLAVDALRDLAEDRSVHVGCDSAQCGACTVLVDDQPVKSCNVLAVQLDGASVVTVRRFANDVGDAEHPVVAAFTDHHAVQCGFCTPGMVLIAVSMLDEHAGPLDPGLVRRMLHGNLCRCTGYQNIVAAICAVADARSAGK